MVDAFVFKDFLIALALGVVIGLEREVAQARNNAQDFAGVRTFTLISVLGAIMGYVSLSVFKSSLFLVSGFFGFTLFIIASYVMIAQQHKKISATTEISALLTFLIGVLCTVGLSKLAVVLTVLIATLLVMRPALHNFAKRIENEELYATFEFGIIALVVLPFLPNYNYSPMNIPFISDIIVSIPAISVEMASQLNVFNPYKIWLMVVFISGISFVGYILIKMYGANAGLGLTGFLGGLVSSTAVTNSFSNESVRRRGLVIPLTLGVVVASSTMFLRVLLEVLVVNNKLIPYVILPIGIMAVVGFAIGFYLWKQEQSDHIRRVEFASPFTLGPALKFGAFFGFVLFFAKLAEMIWGDSGIYIASVVSGLADVDAITITMSNLAATGEISNSVAVTAITLATATNTMVKGGIAYLFGAKEFGVLVMKIFGIMLLFGFGVVVLL